MRINQNKSNNTNTVNQNSMKYDKLSKSNASKLLDKGDVLKAEIVNVKHSTIRLLLANGELIDAKVAEQFEFFIGQKMSFVVKGSNSEQPLLSPILDSQNKLQRILKNAGIMTTNENVNIVTKLIQNQMPIDKESLNKVILNIRQNKDADVDKILFLVKNNIPVTKGNLEQLELIVNNDKLSSHIFSLKDHITTMPDAIIKNEILLSLLKEGLSMVENQDNNLNVKENLDIKGNLDAKENLDIKGNLDAKENLDIKGNLITNDILDIKARQNISKGNLVIKEENLLFHIEKEDIQLLNDKLTEINIQAHGDKSNSILSNINKELYNLIDELNLTWDENHELRNVVSRKVIDTLIRNELMMNKSHLENPDKINEFYKKLYEKVHNLLNLESQSLDGKMNDVVKDANSIKKTIEFMNELNQNYSFVQLPLMLEDKLLNSELYVYNNKKGKKRNSDTFTALIRLDLVNIGHLDIRVSKTRKDITCDFFTENDEKSNMLKSHIYKLHNKLIEFGYHITSMTVKAKEKDFNVIDDFFKAKEEQQDIKRFTIDMRV